MRMKRSLSVPVFRSHGKQKVSLLLVAPHCPTVDGAKGDQSDNFEQNVIAHITRCGYLQ